MSDSYYDPKGLKKFGKIGDFEEGEPKLANKFFDWYGEVFKDGALTAREKALIALAVSHSEKCPYCIDAYTKDCLEKGIEEAEMMEAVQVAGAIAGGAVLVHGVQMMDKVNKLSM